MDNKNNIGNNQEIKKYLRNNNLDETLVENSKFLSEKFKVENGSDRNFVYYEEDSNILSSRIRNNIGSTYRILKNGNVIILEELSRNQQTVHYSIDDPIGDDYVEYSIKKIVYYVDKDDDSLLAKETRETTLPLEVTEQNLYQHGNVEYELDKDNVLQKLELHPSEYYSVGKILEISQLQDRVNALSKENSKQMKMLAKTLDFAETVRKSRIGKIFFERTAQKILGKRNKDVELLPDDYNRFEI